MKLLIIILAAMVLALPFEAAANREGKSHQSKKESGMSTDGTKDIAGYSYGDRSLSRSPISVEEFEKLKQTVLFTEEDRKALKMAGEVLEGQLDDILDLWYGFVGSHDFLVAYFAPKAGKPDGDYLARVRERFRQWILDTCRRPYDQAWLDYQFEIALRHHRTKKNATDTTDAVDIIHMRYLTAFVYPITATIEPFLAKSGHSAEEVEKMHQAWFKSVVLQVTLWTYPYVNDGEF